MMKNSVGIDFGTSNSTCAVLKDEKVSLVPLEKNNAVLPSALFFSTEGEVFFGKEAINLYINGEEGRLLRGLKSILGTSLMSERTVVGKKSRSFQDILSIYISNLKSKTENFIEMDVENVVLGRPVHFHDNDPDADAASEKVLRKIAEDIGFKNIDFQYEPIAAAYSHEQLIEDEQIAIVIDLGGGTSDFTVIRLSPEQRLKTDRKDDVLATTGIRIGGTNFDKSLSVASFMPYLGLGSEYHSEFDKTKYMTMPSSGYHALSDWPLIHQAQSAKAIIETKKLLRTANEPHKIERLLSIQENQLGHALLQSVEHTKIQLTNMNDWVEDLSPLDLDFSVETSREQFLQSIKSQIEKIEQSMHECLNLSGCKASDVGLIILTGGSSEIPAINGMVRNKFPRAKISKEDKFGSVGRGLAYNAIKKFHS